MNLNGQPLCVALVDRVELVAADLSRRAVDEVPHRVDGIGLEDAYATGAVGARQNDLQLRALRKVQLAAPERLRVGHRVNRNHVHDAPLVSPRPGAEASPHYFRPRMVDSNA